MFRGIISPHGEDAALFKKFDIVCTGHFHHKSSRGNIHYLGSHAEFTWADWNDPRGFHVFDTKTLELTFIENPYKMFKKLFYSDQYPDEIMRGIDSSMVKVIVGSKEDVRAFEEYITKIEEQNPLSLQIIDEGLVSGKFDTLTMNESQDTLTMCFHYIDSLEVKDVNKVELKAFIAELYNSV